jgi:hypothetical protein
MKSQKKKSEFEQFDKLFNELITVSHKDLKNKLDMEKLEKKRKPKASASSHGVNGKG